MKTITKQLPKGLQIINKETNPRKFWMLKTLTSTFAALSSFRPDSQVQVMDFSPRLRCRLLVAIHALGPAAQTLTSHHMIIPYTHCPSVCIWQIAHCFFSAKYLISEIIFSGLFRKSTTRFEAIKGTLCNTHSLQFSFLQGRKSFSFRISEVMQFENLFNRFSR